MARKPVSEQGDTLARVQHEAFTLFGRYGYDGVSMLNVAKAAGVTKAALYWHYDGKEALYADCMRQLGALFREHVFARTVDRRDPLARLMAVFEGMGRLLADPKVQSGVAGYWLHPSTAEVPEARAVQAQFEQASADYVAETLKEAVDAGQLSLTVPVEDMAHAFITTVEGLVLPLRRHSPQRMRRLIGVLADTFFRAHSHSDEIIATAIDVAMAPVEDGAAA